MGAEISAAASSVDRAWLIAECLETAYGAPSPLPLVVSVDSNGL